MGPHYVGYFNPATAAMPLSPLLVALLLPAVIWSAISAFRLNDSRIGRVIWIAYGLYALVVGQEYWHILEWRWAAGRPEDYLVAEGQVTDYRQREYVPAQCIQPVAGVLQFTKGSDDVEQSFEVMGETFASRHKRRPLLDFLVPRLSVPQLPLAAGARVRITYRLASYGKEFLNVEIGANDVSSNWCHTFPAFLPRQVKGGS